MVCIGPLHFSMVFRLRCLLQIFIVAKLLVVHSIDILLVFFVIPTTVMYLSEFPMFLCVYSSAYIIALFTIQLPTMYLEDYKQENNHPGIPIRGHFVDFDLLK